MEEFNNFVATWWPVVLAFAGLIFWAGRFVSKTEGSIRGLEGSIKGLGERLDDTNKFIGMVLDAVISGGGQNRIPPVSGASSPVSLTEYGTDIANRIQADQLIERYANILNIEKDSNEYHIQKTCFHYAQFEMLDILSDEERDSLEKLAFNDGIPIANILHVIGIKLRDYKLQELGKNIGDANKRTPELASH